MSCLSVGVIQGMAPALPHLAEGPEAHADPLRYYSKGTGRGRELELFSGATTTSTSKHSKARNRGKQARDVSYLVK